MKRRANNPTINLMKAMIVFFGLWFILAAHI
jgi:hypothetical protein